MEDGGAERGNWDRLAPEVLDRIFQHLPVSDLLSCSVMSTQWKNVARDILKRSRECYAHINYFDQDIQDLNEMIVSSDIMQTINGLCIRNEARPEGNIGSDISLWHRSRRCSDVAKLLQSEEAARKLDETKQTILSVMCGEWQYLDLDMSGPRGHSVSLDQGLLLREVILATSDSLQKLVVGQNLDWKFIPCCAKPFLKLQFIQAQKEQDLDCCWDSSLSKFAPNLKEITGVIMNLAVPFQGDHFMLERMKSVKAFPECHTCGNLFNEGQCPMPYWVVPQGEDKDVLRAVSGLHRLDLQSYRRHPFDVRVEQNIVEWNACVFPFVLRSLNTLKELRMYTLDLYNLSVESDGLKFPNLRRLSLATQRNVTRANEISALKILNLPKLCPYLEQVEFTDEYCQHEIQQEVIPADIADGLDQSDMPVAVTWKCKYGQYNQEQMTLLSTIYPKIRRLRMMKIMSGSDYDASTIFLPSFWDLQSLEYLEISFPDPPRDVQFHIEAFLSGINIEEARSSSLRSQRKEDMLNLCIVPIRPSLLNAKSLKELKITVETHYVNKLRPLDRGETISRSWVIQVAENLPERHVHNVQVTIDANKRLCDRLARMKVLAWLRANEIRA